MKSWHDNSNKLVFTLIALLFLSLAISTYGIYSHSQTRKELVETKETLSIKNAELDRSILENNDLAYQLNGERDRNNSFEGQIKDIASTVGVLDKLQKTDEELLQKYSKVYFLNEHYVPPSLLDVNPDYLFNKDRPELIHRQVEPRLNSLLKAGTADNMELRILSAYRSFSEQTNIKTNYKVLYGSGANQFSADQGFSEHQLGTTIDFTTQSTGESFSKFKSTPEYKWLTENAYKYGFTLSYPEGNSYYQYEPWHWRFVGVELATKLHNEGKFFYDLDQRTIDEYLVKIFD